MKIKVVAAVIVKDQRYLCCLKTHGNNAEKWEFPGGKVEIGESNEMALKREIREELGIDIKVNSFLVNVTYPYPNFTLDMDVYLCEMLSEQIILNEHGAYAFVSEDEFSRYDFAPADQLVVDAIKDKRK